MLNFSARKGDFKHGHSTDAGGQRLQGLVLQKSLRRRKGKSIMVAGVPRAKLQDADAHGNPLGWSTVASISFIANISFRSQLTNLLQRIHSRILCGRGGRIQDATFLSFWRHGANYSLHFLVGNQPFCLTVLSPVSRWTLQHWWSQPRSLWRSRFLKQLRNCTLYIPRC